MSFVTGYRGLVLGIAIGIVAAGIPAAVFFAQTGSLQGQNAALNRNLSDARNELAHQNGTLANDTRTIASLRLDLANLTGEIQLLHSVVNFSAFTVFAHGNLTIAKNTAYGWFVGGSSVNMSEPGYLAVVFVGGVANSNSTSVDAHVGIQFINKSANWEIETTPQLVLVTYLPPMGGYVDFVNDGNPAVWVNFQILYLT